MATQNLRLLFSYRCMSSLEILDDSLIWAAICSAQAFRVQGQMDQIGQTDNEATCVLMGQAAQFKACRQFQRPNRPDGTGSNPCSGTVTSCRVDSSRHINQGVIIFVSTMV